MDVAPSPSSYQRPPTRMPFAPLGRNFFVIVFIALLLTSLLPFLGSIVVAGIFALGMHKPIEALSQKLGGRRRSISALFVVLVVLLISFPASFLGIRTYQVLSDKDRDLFSGETLDRAQAAYTKVEQTALEYSVGAKVFESTADARESLRQAATQAAKMGGKTLSGALASLPEIFLVFFVFCLFLYAFLANPEGVKNTVYRLNVFKKDDLDRATKILQASSYNSLVANFLVGIIQASVITIGARCVGYNESVLIFSCVFALSYIPFIGAAPPGYLLALISLLLGNTGDAIIMAVIATVAGVIDNVVRPYLVSSGEDEVHPVLSFAAILGAIGVFGLKGLFIGPVILTAAVSFLGSKKDNEEEKDAASA
jgi:predicted PurR-regulated permease PerM